jgi:hypothetical protein
MGVTLTLGQVLDPLNDLVEQFASLMLTAAVAFGIQKVLLAMGAHWAISLAVTAVAVAWAALYYQGQAPLWLSRLLVVLVMVRFAIPVITIGSDWAFQAFLENKYNTAQTALGGVAGDANKSAIRIAEKGNREIATQAESNTGQGAVAGSQNNKETSWWEKAKSVVNGGTDKAPATVEGQDNRAGSWLDGLRQKFAGLDVPAKLNALKDSVDRATDHIIDLMVVFLLQTVVIPLVLLWGLLKVAGGMLLLPPVRRPRVTTQ